MSHAQLTASSGLIAVVFSGLLMLPLALTADGPGRGFLENQVNDIDEMRH